jgi:SAM-dependent methyltransferase
MTAAAGVKQVHDASRRNAGPILDVLRSALPARGLVLEVASGSGFHAATFAAALPGVTWQPSDPDAAMRASIEAHRADAGPANLLAPIHLDVTAWPWPVDKADAVVCINMIHIAPWAACEALFAGAGRVLGENGVVFTYGPYRVDGDWRGDGNVAFDQSLRSRNPDWGIRELRDVEAVAAGHGLALVATVAMPANNLSLVFRKRGGRDR